MTEVYLKPQHVINITDRPSIFDLDVTAHKALWQEQISEKFAMSYESYGHTKQAEQYREDARRWQAEHDAAVRIFELVTGSTWQELTDECFGYSLEQRLVVHYNRNRPAWLKPMNDEQVTIWISCQVLEVQS